MVAIGAKPTAAKTKGAPPSDACVETPLPEAEPTNRLTLEIPADLRARIKAARAMRGTKMVDEITALREENFG